MTDIKKVSQVKCVVPYGYSLDYLQSLLYLLITEMPKKKEKDIFQKIEAVYGSIPTCLKTILRNSGFDNGLSLALLNENAIRDIESYIQENGENIINTLQCCNSDNYKSQIAKNEFKFAPGHKYTILAIADKTREMNLTENWSSKENRKVAVIAPVIIDSPSTSVDRSENEQISNENWSQMSDSIAVSMDVIPEKALKLQLLNKLKEAMKKTPNVNQVELPMDESSVIELEIQMVCNKPNGSGKCVCCHCGKSIQATCVNGNWRAHNVIRHLRKHLSQEIGVANITDDETRCQPWNEGQVEETMNRNEETDKAANLDVLKEFDPYFK